MKSADLYVKTLQGYSSLLPVLKKSLFSYCKDYKVNYRGLRQWMRENAIAIPKSKQQFDPAEPVSSFSPLVILDPPSPDKHSFCSSSLGMLRGVQITLPNGLHVSIREISGTDMSVLIEKLNPR
jgi:hypothetical protein